MLEVSWRNNETPHILFSFSHVQRHGAVETWKWRQFHTLKQWKMKCDDSFTHWSSGGHAKGRPRERRVEVGTENEFFNYDATTIRQRSVCRTGREPGEHREQRTQHIPNILILCVFSWEKLAEFLLLWSQLGDGFCTWLALVLRHCW